LRWVQVSRIRVPPALPVNRRNRTKALGEPVASGAAQSANQQLDQDVDQWEQSCISATESEANQEWAQWLPMVQADNGAVDSGNEKIDGACETAQKNVDQSAETSATGMASLDQQVAGQLAEAHQTWYVKGVQWATSNAVQVAQDQVGSDSSNPPTISAGATSIPDSTDVIQLATAQTVPFVGGSYCLGATAMLGMVEHSKGVTFAGHCFAPMGAGGGGGSSDNGPGFGSLYWHYFYQQNLAPYVNGANAICNQAANEWNDLSQGNWSNFLNEHVAFTLGNYSNSMLFQSNPELQQFAGALGNFLDPGAAQNGSTSAPLTDLVAGTAICAAEAALPKSCVTAPAGVFGEGTLGAAERPFQEILESEIIDALSTKNPGIPNPQTLSFRQILSRVRLSNPDDLLGPLTKTQVKIVVQMEDELTGELINISVNYDPATGWFGIIKPSSIQP
jgi:hypothetical protein